MMNIIYSLPLVISAAKTSKILLNEHTFSCNILFWYIESRVNLPYHQPEPKPLSDFLARASRKQELYRSLHKTRDLQ